ncbi:uncharacterized protein LOC141907585 [Tubulanus polymorphus]|uniref:uncharacterized protein LOC141907585 n=1 Tax=Tubulanus polymorphus TaxID=672921 RepID=UPI003DA2CA5C
MLNCSCFDPNYASPNTDALKDLSSKAKHPCSTDTESECMSRVYSLIDASDVCDIKTCPPICKEFKYRIATSAADWPSKPKIPAIMNMIKKVRPALDIYEEEETNTTTTNSTTNATASDSNSTSSTDEPTTTTITVTSPVITTTVSSMAPAGPSPSPSSLAPVTITSGTQAPAPPPPPPPPGPKKGQVNPQYISENFIKIDVYFEDLNEEIYVTTAAYSEIDLLTDMGGTCGLWMGISVIAIIEVIQFCVEVGLLCFYRYKTSEETKVKPLRQSPNRSPYRERSVTPQTEEWYLDDIPEKNGIYNDRKF